MLDPPKLEKYIGEVTIFQASDSIRDVLIAVRKHHYSQFPVYSNGGFRGLVTENGITRWLAHHAEDDLFSTADTRVEDVLECEENQNNVKFIARTNTIYEALDSFSEAMETGVGRIEAAIITHRGTADDKPLGIITTWDVVNERLQFGDGDN